MAKIINKPSLGEIQQKLAERLDWSKKYRRQFERQWDINSDIVDSANGFLNNDATLGFSSKSELGDLGVESPNFFIGTNFIFKYVRFIHSQLSSNPPSVVISPTSPDAQDRRKADAADRILRHIRQDKNLQEVVDQCTLKTLRKSIGWIKVLWNPDKGDIFDFNEETREVVMEGDIDIYSPSTDDIWIDPDAKRWDEVRYTFERLFLSKEEAIFRFPNAKDKIESIVAKYKESGKLPEDDSRFEPRIEIYEYYEKGMPLNGGVGMRAYVLENGELLEEPTKNPHVNASLPLKALTYLDQEDQLYGKSVVEYAAPLQDYLNRIDSSILDNVANHGAVRLFLPNGTDIEEGSLSDEPSMIIRGTGNVPPTFLNTPQLMPDIWKHRQTSVDGIQDLFGINDSMLGIQRREQSAVSQQTSIESGSAIHRRLFIKYAMFIESIYRDCISLVKKNWDTPRTVLVLGKEKAFQAADLKGADIAGGFDFKVEYGASLPIDPNARREFLLLNMPLFKEAGVTSKEILKLMKLDDVGGAFDRVEMSADRQREIFEEMEMAWRANKPIYIAPEEMEDHLSRIEWARTYLETSEFKYLPEGLKALIKQHIKDRIDLAAKEAAPAQANPTILPAGIEGAPNIMPMEPLAGSGIV